MSLLKHNHDGWHFRDPNPPRTWHEKYKARKEAADQLRFLSAAVSTSKSRPDGYTTGELQREGDIGKGLWQQIRRAAGIQVARGQSARRFTNAEIGKLIAAARNHNTPKARQAAKNWEKLLARNAAS